MPWRELHGLKRVYTTLLRTRFRLWQRPRLERVVVERVAGRPLVVLPGVMNPNVFRTGAFFAKTLARQPLIP